MKRSLLLTTTILLSLILGCGNSGNFGGDANAIAPFVPVVYRIGVIAPLEAGQVDFGRGIRNSAQLAVNQWNNDHQLTGPLFELVALDDSSTPSVGVAAAQQLAADPQVIGVVGTYNSGVAQEVIPVLEAAGIALISPGNTDPALTLGPDPQNPVRPSDNYFRLVVPDTVQGPTLADFAFSDLGVREVAVVTESKEVSQGLADAFTDRFQQLGGTIVTTEVVPAGTNDYSAILARVALTQPELLFYAGEVPNASIVRTQATQAGITVPLMGGDGMKSQSYIDDAGADSEGDFASSVGAPPELLPSAANFLSSYQAAGFAEGPSDFGPYAFDATQLLIQAATSIRGGREGILTFLELVDQQGVTGRLSFDSFGDTLNKVLTIYRVEGGVFVPEEVVTIPN